MKRIDSREIAITTDSQRQELATLLEDMENSKHPSVRAYAVRLRDTLFPGERSQPLPILSDENYVKGRDNR